MVSLSPLFFVLMVGTVLVSADTERKPTRLRKPKRPTSSTSDIIGSLMQDYNQEEPPLLDASTEVRIGVYINDFSINTQTMEYSVSMYLRQAWRDPRLAFTPPDDKTTKLTMNYIWDKLWIPDTYFRNQKLKSTKTNSLLRWSQNGDVWYVTKRTATFSCPMKLQKFPFDTQMCSMFFESFSYTTDTLYFAWLDSPVDVDGDVVLPQFTLNDVILDDCSQNYTAGSFPCLEMRFIFQRDKGYFIKQVFVPSLLVVILSWAAFWLNLKATTARVLLGLVTLFALSTKNSAASSLLPPVSYMKALDVWMGVCFFFVLFALLETVLVNAVSSKKGTGTELVNTLRKCFPKCFKTDLEDKGGELKDESESDNSQGMQKARKIDLVSCVVFPVLFFLFNIIYWSLYT